MDLNLDFLDNMDPWGLSSTLASVYLRNQQANAEREWQQEQIRRSNALAAAEMARQQQFSGQNAGIVNQAIEAAAPDPMEAVRAQAEAKLRAAFSAAPTATGANVGTYQAASGAPPEVVEQGQRTVDAAKAAAASRANSLAKLKSYGIADLYGNLAMQNAGGQVALNNNLAGGSARATGLQQRTNANSFVGGPGNRAAIFSDILGGYGDIANINAAATARKARKTPAPATDDWMY